MAWEYGRGGEPRGASARGTTPHDDEGLSAGGTTPVALVCSATVALAEHIDRVAGVWEVYTPSSPSPQARIIQPYHLDEGASYLDPLGELREQFEFWEDGEGQLAGTLRETRADGTRTFRRLSLVPLSHSPRFLAFVDAHRFFRLEPNDLGLDRPLGLPPSWALLHHLVEPAHLGALLLAVSAIRLDEELGRVLGVHLGRAEECSASRLTFPGTDGSPPTSTFPATPPTPHRPG